MYREIDSNKKKTVLLVTLVIAFIIGIGWFFSWYFNNPSLLVIASFVAFLHTLFSYYYSDRIALFSAGAREVTAKEEPMYVHLLENLAITAGIPTPKAYVIEEDAINAFACGRDPKHSAVAVTRGAITKLNKVELEGVLAHEISHIRNFDILLATIVVALVGLISILSDFFFRFGFWGRGDERREGSGLLAILGVFLLIFAPLIGTLIQLAVSRNREYLADASGALLTRFPEGLARALEKILAENQPLARANSATAHLYFANPFANFTSSFKTLFSTHPPIQERIRRLRKMF